MTTQQEQSCKKLRQQTGIGIFNCKRCLIKYNWDFDKAKKNIFKFTINKT